MTQNFVQPHNAVTAPLPDLDLKCLIIDGPRGTGKTTLIQAIQHIWPLSYGVKFRSFADLPKVRHTDNSIIVQTTMIDFLKQTPGTPCPFPIFDRMIGTDWVMSSVTERETDWSRLASLDMAWSQISAQVILTCDEAVRLKRSSDRASEGDSARLQYEWFEWSKMTMIPTRWLDTTDQSPLVLATSIVKWLERVQAARRKLEAIPLE